MTSDQSVSHFLTKVSAFQDRDCLFSSVLPTPFLMPGTQQTSQAPCHSLALSRIPYPSWNLILGPLWLSCPFLSSTACHATALPPECSQLGLTDPFAVPTKPLFSLGVTACTALPLPAGCFMPLAELELLTCLFYVCLS